jgi:predicted dehydrogenase
VPVSEEAKDVVREATDGQGVDQSLVTAASSSSDPLLLAAELARDRATVVLIGDVQIDVPRDALYMKELSFRVSRSYGPGRYDTEYEERGVDYPIGYVRWTEQRNMECVLGLQACGALTLRDLIDDVVPVERAGSAYARLTGPPEGRPRGALAFSYGSAEGAGETSPSVPVRQTAGAPSLRGRPGAVRVGLIGPGRFANSVLVPAFARAGASLVAVAGGAGPSAERMARKDGLARATTSEELLGADDVDVVVIATRHDTHANLARECLEAGKNVFCEKPLALGHDELGEVLLAANGAQRILAVGFNRRFAPHVAEVNDFLAPVDAPLTAVYRVSAGHIDASSWVHALEQGGGRLIGEACHFLDTLTFLTGSRISEVHAAGFGSAELPVQARDNVVVTLNFEDGSVGSLVYVAGGASGVAKERLEVFAGDRTAILDDYRTLELHEGDDHIRHRLRAQDKGHSQEVERFLAGIAEGREPIPLATIANVHRACFGAVESLLTGTVVPVGDANQQA